MYVCCIFRHNIALQKADGWRNVYGAWKGAEYWKSPLMYSFRPDKENTASCRIWKPNIAAEYVILLFLRKNNMEFLTKEIGFSEGSVVNWLNPLPFCLLILGLVFLDAGSQISYSKINNNNTAYTFIITNA